MRKLITVIMIVIMLTGCSFAPAVHQQEILTSPPASEQSSNVSTDAIQEINPVPPQPPAKKAPNAPEQPAVVLELPADKYPDTAAHIAEAIAAGKSPVCTIDREGADHNREQSLAGIDTKKGYDRDEWPMAMCEEGGEGADIAYVKPADNRGAGSWVGNQLDDYPDGTRIMFKVTSDSKKVVQAAKSDSLESTPTLEPTPATPITEVYYENFTAVRAAGANPIHTGDPGYSSKLDRDGDGVGCE